MLKALFTWLGLSLCTLGYLGTTNNPVLAQVTSDGTVNTQVTENGKTAEITGGETRGDNLFHSFQDFSVRTGNEAFFNNADTISNIFSRVTGGNVSNIDGAIRANGSANLFLINPAGIIFGENASLNIGGSFYGSSASSILFEDGEFSATDLENPPLLTINAPIGLGFRDQPGDITVRGDGQGTRTTTDLIDVENALRVNGDKTFALVGGKINIEGGTIKTTGGRIELGSLEGNEQVRLTPINKGFGLDYAGVQNFQDLQLSKTATIDASGLVAGDIQVQGKNISLTEGSQIEAGTLGDSLSQDLPGTIKINAIDTIKIDGKDSSNSFPSGIYSQVYSGAVGNGGELNITTTNFSLTNGGSISVDTFGEGNGGNLNITTANLSLTNSGLISSDTFGQGNAGSIDINAAKSINLDNSLIKNVVGEDATGKDATGNGGNLNITTANLSLDSSFIQGSTTGKGDGGLIDINATESITLEESSISSTAGLDMGGNAGELNITTPNFSLTTDSSIAIGTYEQGGGGKLSINSTNLSLTDGSAINGDTSGQGNAGSVDINATKSIILDLSYISSTAHAEGNGGNLNITTANLSLTNSSSIQADASGQGDAGLIEINATESITLDRSYIFTSTSAEGNGGEIDITANNFSLTNTSQISSRTKGVDFVRSDGSKFIDIARGDGGNITIDVADTLSINGATTVDYPVRAGIFASNEGASTGNAGNIDITARKLSLINGGQINSLTSGEGNAGNTTINAQDSIFLSGENKFSSSGVFNNVQEKAGGNGGTINITTKNLSVFDGATISASSNGQGDGGLIDINADVISLDNGKISAQAFNNANGGNLEIDADVIVAFPGKDSNILASAEQGNGGNITINAESVLGIEERPLNNSTNDINASSEVSGLDGSVNINTSDINPVQGASELPSNVVEAKQTTDQTCSADREGKVNNGLAIAGRGGVHPAPDAPLNSENISNKNPAQASIPQPLETSQGKIQPARGIKVTKSGKIILTAYRTNDAGERIPEIKPNCN